MLRVVFPGTNKTLLLALSLTHTHTLSLLQLRLLSPFFLLLRLLLLFRSHLSLFFFSSPIKFIFVTARF